MAVTAGILSLVWMFVATWSVARGSGYSGEPAADDPVVLITTVLILTVMTVAACFRRRHPMWMYLLTLVGTVALAVLFEDRVAAATPLYWFAIIVMAGRTTGSRLVLLTIAGMLADLWMTTRFRPGDAGESMTLAQVPAGDLPEFLLAPAVNIMTSYAVMIVIGKVVQRYRAQSSASAAAIEQMQLNSDARISDAITEERQNMARELHDVAAHHLTGLLIQARSAWHDPREVTRKL
ncbi:histidine kinase dimerization/phosphoacceptor domain-containing protein [Rhodococcus globerulus]|uniref:histidine kinase dimerization/phosphoacceptor domain-containing protein n=1 Tax=Rhodococcus globerulus TaxID=33008 RepID=UPI003017AF36